MSAKLRLRSIDSLRAAFPQVVSSSDENAFTLNFQAGSSWYRLLLRLPAEFPAAPPRVELRSAAGADVAHPVLRGGRGHTVTELSVLSKYAHVLADCCCCPPRTAPALAYSRGCRRCRR